mgnify:CR=1 FL=1
MPETKPKAPLTPEELRWRAAARDPDKAKRNLKLQYILLGCAIAASIGWGIYLFRTDVISRSDWLPNSLLRIVTSSNGIFIAPG